MSCTAIDTSIVQSESYFECLTYNICEEHKCSPDMCFCQAALDEEMVNEGFE